MVNLPVLPTNSEPLIELQQDFTQLQQIKQDFGQQQKKRVAGDTGRITLSPASSSCLKFPPVKFWVNPTKIKLTKQTTTAQGATTLVASSFEQAVTQSGQLTIALSDIRLVGAPYTATTAHVLLALATPWPKGSTLTSTTGTKSPGLVIPADPTGAGKSSNAMPTARPSMPTQQPGSGGTPAPKEDWALPTVLFSWGDGLIYMVMVKSTTVDITRISPSGAPVSASVELTLVMLPENVRPTNPTSGGPPGRAKHTVVSGDSLVGIAVHGYGDPGAWRAIAVANNLDDPLRLAAGDELYLPGPAELTELDGRKVA